MARFKPAMPFNVSMMLLIPTAERIKGVTKTTYPDAGPVFDCSFRTFGGTETEKDGVYITRDTAIINTWYRPDIKAGCRVAMTADPAEVYEIIGTPEDIDRRHQWLQFKVIRYGGGVNG